MPMAERRPPGFNVDLGFYDSEEVLSIPRRLRAAAVGVWTLCGAYSANKLSDGYVTVEALRDRGCTPAIRDALMSTTPQPLWEDAGNGAIRFTRWSKWQRTSGEIKAYREAEAERKRKAREAKKAARDDQVSDTYASAGDQLANGWSSDDDQVPPDMDDTYPSRDHVDNATTSGNGETSGRTSGGRASSVRPEHRDPKTETETETETVVVGYVSRPPRKRGSRLPEGWLPSDTAIAAMRDECPTVNLQAEHRKFVDYWTAKAGKDATKLSWDATWRNWIRRASEGSSVRAPLRAVNGGMPIATSDLRVMQAQALKDQPNDRLGLE